MVSLGTIFPPQLPPEQLLPTARAADAAGLEQLWLWEDCFFESGLGAAAAALGATDRLVVGVGVMPAPLRNVALAAMEVATLERVFPGRFVAGFGHGVQDWMGQAGARVASPLTLLREYTEALRALLSGETVSVDGRYVQLDQVRLEWPPPSAPALHLAGEGVRTLALVGEVGDGLVIPGGYPPEKMAAARDAALAARQAAGVERPLTLSIFLPVTVGPGAERHPGRGMVSGTPAEVADGLAAWIDAGADHVLLLDVSDEPDPVAFAELLGTEVAPRL
ncbi:MAG: LLM class flavin-dependent oxidoreductase [Acidimicrobiales bacterium]